MKSSVERNLHWIKLAGRDFSASVEMTKRKGEVSKGTVELSKRRVEMTRGREWAALFARIDEAFTDGISDDLRPVLDVEFVQDVSQMVFDGILGHNEFCSQVLVGRNPGNQ